jgi:hypothetical protein
LFNRTCLRPVLSFWIASHIALRRRGEIFLEKKYYQELRLIMFRVAQLLCSKAVEEKKLKVEIFFQKPEGQAVVYEGVEFRNAVECNIFGIISEMRSLKNELMRWLL